LRSLAEISKDRPVAILDSCGQSNLGSKYLIAGIEPIETLTLDGPDPDHVLKQFTTAIERKNTAAIFTISYDFGLKLQNFEHSDQTTPEPDIYAVLFENLVVYNYESKQIKITGRRKTADRTEHCIKEAAKSSAPSPKPMSSKAVSNFTSDEYISRIVTIQEEIRAGNTYQTNLTQQFSSQLHEQFSAIDVFLSLRDSHPAAFAAFISRPNDDVVSISPERFIRVAQSIVTGERRIESSPIKGTAKRTGDSHADEIARTGLFRSEKNRAENTMIVDLIRNDLGRVCKFGTVNVDKLCDLEEHPTLFHLVSTVSGNLRDDVDTGDILRAVFPCGSITGCPKLSTMSIIERLETRNRGLSMGAIGYSDFENNIDMSVAIRTMTVNHKNQAVFNVGGGIVIDSNPVEEFEESLLKAKALVRALGAFEP
jgi:para-aminobenzoate synthetase component 1